MKFKWVRVAGNDDGAYATFAADLPTGVLLQVAYFNVETGAVSCALTFVPGIEVDEDGDLDRTDEG